MHTKSKFKDIVLANMNNEPIANKYQVDNVIAKGALGYVFKGHHLKTGEQVAIKVDSNSTQYITIPHETRVLNYLASYRTKGVPNIYWFGQWKEMPTLVMTLYECSLFDYMTHKIIDTHILNPLFEKILLVIHHIHERFVLHRDIKPQNFMIKKGEIFLIDFGLSIFLVNAEGKHYPDEPQTNLIGTLKFMSLRVLEGHRYARRDDLFSIGYMYIYMLRGNALWEPETSHNEGMHACIEINHPTNQKRVLNKQFDNLMKICGLEPHTHIFKYLQNVYSLEYAETTDYVFS